MPEVTGGTGIGVWIALVLTVLAIAVPAVWVIRSGEPRSFVMVNGLAVPVDRPSATHEGGIRANANLSVEHVAMGTNVLGASYWVVTLKNVGGAPVSHPGVVVPEAEGEPSGWSILTQLDPGASTTVLVAASAPVTSAVNPQAVSMDADGPHDQVVLDVGPVQVREEGGLTKLTGDVVWRGAAAVEEPRVMAVGFNAGGEAVAIVHGSLEATRMEPGQAVSFALSPNAFVVEPASTWQVVGVARTP